jgi:hypothetical protein
MNLAMLTWLTLGACLIYIITQDPNVYTWLVLQSKLFTSWCSKQWFLIRYNPDSPWIRFTIDRNAKRIAKEILKENEKR